MKEELENYVFKNQEDYRNALDKAPEKNWLQIRSLGKKNHDFIPLFIIQGNADFFFKEWYVIEEKFMAIQGGVACTVKIQALPDYPNADIIFFTGTAAVLFKESKNAVEFDMPNARERAIGKAFSTLGNIFGRNLNRTYKIIQSGKEVTTLVKPDFSFRKK